MTTKTIFDAVAKREAAESVLDSKDPRQAFRELRRLHDLQPYQAYAWVGQAAIARAAKAAGETSVVGL